MRVWLCIAPNRWLLALCWIFPRAGAVQAVPRAELHAFIVVLLFLAPGALATIYTDSALCAKGFASKHRIGEMQTSGICSGEPSLVRI